MSRLGRSIGAAFLLVGIVAGSNVRAADWRDTTPEGWLAAVEVGSLPVLEERLAALREPLGSKAWPLAEMTTRLFGSQLAQRPWALVAVPAGRGGPAPVFFVPTDDFDAFCRGIDADRADDLAIGKLLGFEVAALYRDGWAVLTFLEQAAALELPAAEKPPRPLDADLLITFSPAGLAEAADEATERQRRRLAARRRRRSPAPFRMPSDLNGVVELLTPTAPVFRTLVGFGRSVGIGVSRDTATGDWRIVADWDVALESGATEDAAGASALSIEDPLARLDAVGLLPQPLVDLGLAVVQSSPGALIEAAEFPQPQWDDFADSVGDLLRGVRSPSVVLAEPGPDDPIAANQAIAFDWPGEPQQLGDAIGLAVLRWNLLVATARARSPMRVALEPLPADAGWLLSIDVLGAAGGEPIPEVKQVLGAFYGDPERLRVRITRRNDTGGWLASTLPAKPRVTTERQATGGARVTGAFDVSRWFAWDHRIKTFGLENAIGPKPKPPNLPPTRPATLRLTTSERIRLEATLPHATYRAAAGVLGTQ